MGENLDQALSRAQAFTWLDNALLNKPVLTWGELVGGYNSPLGDIPLVGQRGIWNPRQLEYTLSITSTSKGIYEDTWLSSDVVEYAYQGGTGVHGDNRKLRAAMRDQVPLIYFRQLRKGYYLPHFPVFVVGDDQERRVFTISLTKSLNLSEIDEYKSSISKEYREEIVRRRLHQPRFRAEVLLAYKETCAICRLRHAPLIDAAHILPDSWDDSIAAVSNGLALCKIHHAAYDKNFLGISPDFQVKVREDIMLEVDGPMLREGMQAMDGLTITTPRRKELKPNREYLERRFRLFENSQTIGI